VEKAISFRLSIIGEGPLCNALKAQVATSGLDKCVAFKGSVPHSSLPDWYRASDLFVLPSRSEGVPSVLLEASACATPWVASEVGGIPEIADLGLSRLTPAEAPSALAVAILESLNSHSRLLSNSPRSHAESVDELGAFLESTITRTKEKSTMVSCPR
jgi:glycosyltransferase involved in cell wall biosynthesis